MQYAEGESMKWKIIKKGNVYKRRPELETEDWICLGMLLSIVIVVILREIIRRM